MCWATTSSRRGACDGGWRVSKVLRTVGTIAGVVALSLAIPGAGTALGLAASGAGSAASIAAYATLASGVANLGAQLTAKKPAARGSINNVIIASDAPAPYLMGRTYTGGVLRHDTGWGGKVGKVQNPYRVLVRVASVAGPLDGLEATLLDYQAVAFAGAFGSVQAASGYYGGFLWRDAQLGARPEASALALQWAGAPGWGAASKLSGKAATALSLMFDKDGKRFASGVPVLGEVWRGVMAYDPRADATYPGGAGAQRAANEATWAYSENPGLHALTYALGRFVNSVKVMGIGQPIDGIDVAAFVAFANVCDANNWKVGGTIYEPGDRWANLKAILAAGGGKPMFAGGRLSVRYNAPRVAIARIGKADVMGKTTVRGMQSWRARLNGIIPKYRSEAHRWDYVPSDLVSIPAYVIEDGEEKSEERQYDLIQQKDQGAQLAAYELVDGRELVFETEVGERFRFYKPGDMLTVALGELLDDASFTDVDAVVESRTIDPATLVVSMVLTGESAGKHAFALSRTGTAPPTPTLVPPATRDALAVINTGAEVTAGPGLPGTANDDDVRFDTADANRQYVWVGGAWVAATSAASDATVLTVPITSQTAASGTFTVTLPPGASLPVTASIRVTGLSGTMTQTIAIQSREAGGSFATLGTPASDSGGAGDTVNPVAAETLVNPTGQTRVYEVRALPSKAGGTGTVDQSQSYLTA